MCVCVCRTAAAFIAFAAAIASLPRSMSSVMRGGGGGGGGAKSCAAAAVFLSRRRCCFTVADSSTRAPGRLLQRRLGLQSESERRRRRRPAAVAGAPLDCSSSRRNSRSRRSSFCSAGGNDEQNTSSSSSSSSSSSCSSCTSPGDNDMNVLGCIWLVCGTAVGAGALALPARTIAAGFGPSSAALVGVWAMLLGEGLLLAEVNVKMLKEEEEKAKRGLSTVRRSGRVRVRVRARVRTRTRTRTRRSDMHCVCFFSSSSSSSSAAAAVLAERRPSCACFAAHDGKAHAGLLRRSHRHERLPVSVLRRYHGVHFAAGRGLVQRASVFGAAPGRLADRGDGADHVAVYKRFAEVD